MIKQKLYENPELIKDILKELGFHKIRELSNEIRAALPDGNNWTSTVVKLNENLTTYIYSRNDYDGRDIISLVQYIKKTNFWQAIKWLCLKLGIDYNNNDIEIKLESSSYKIFKMFEKKGGENIIHEILDEEILNQYEDKVIQEWLDEGISEETQRKFEVKFDSKANRIVFPIRDENGNLINIKGRTCFSNYKELGIPKYIYYYKLGMNDILYGLYQNRNSIQDTLIIVEGEKSVMKFDSLGINNVVAVGTHTINKYQLDKILALKCREVVIAFDKDVQYKELIEEAKKLSRYVNVSIIYDTNNYLNEKDAPIDQGLLVWEELFERRIPVGY